MLFAAKSFSDPMIALALTVMCGVGGCGFCGGFDIVQALGYALWPKGTKKPHGTRNGEPDTCGGYALTHCNL